MKIKTSKLFKAIAIAICFLLCLEQSGFAQVAGQLDISSRFASLQNNFIQDKFRPLHLRFLQYDPRLSNFRLLLDKGNIKTLSNSLVEQSTNILLKYFLVGVSLPSNSFWVNLRPDSPDNIIDPLLAKTDVGKILLEADVQLKKDTASFTSPQTPEGKDYWDKLYKKAEEIYGSQNVTIPTLTRPWIVPGEIIIRETQDNAYIYKANLKVMLEEDYLKNSVVYNFKDNRAKELNTYASSILRAKIIPRLTLEVNTSKRYAALRQVYYSLILAQWFKQKFYGSEGIHSKLINSGNLSGLASKDSWSKITYFQQYQKSFKDGEYNLSSPVSTPQGQVIRSYFSGGIKMEVPLPVRPGTVINPESGEPITKTVPGDEAAKRIPGNPLNQIGVVSNGASSSVDKQSLAALTSSPAEVSAGRFPNFIKTLLGNRSRPLAVADIGSGAYAEFESNILAVLKALGFIVGNSISVDKGETTETLTDKVKKVDVTVEAERDQAGLANESRDLVTINNIISAELIPAALKILKAEGVLLVTFAESDLAKWHEYSNPQIIAQVRAMIEKLAQSDPAYRYEIREINRPPDYPISNSKNRTPYPSYGKMIVVIKHKVLASQAAPAVKTGLDIKIEEASSREVGAVAEFRQEHFIPELKEEPANLSVAEFVSYYGPKIKDGTVSLFIARDNQKIMGYILVRKTNGNGWIYEVSVHPDYRGRGVGRSLFKAGLDFLQKDQNKVTTIMVTDWSANGATGAMAKSFGFKETQEGEGRFVLKVKPEQKIQVNPVVTKKSEQGSISIKTAILSALVALLVIVSSVFITQNIKAHRADRIISGLITQYESGDRAPLLNFDTTQLQEQATKGEPEAVFSLSLLSSYGSTAARQSLIKLDDKQLIERAQNGSGSAATALVRLAFLGKPSAQNALKNINPNVFVKDVTKPVKKEIIYLLKDLVRFNNTKALSLLKDLANRNNKDAIDVLRAIFNSRALTLRNAHLVQGVNDTTLIFKLGELSFNNDPFVLYGIFTSDENFGVLSSAILDILKTQARRANMDLASFLLSLDPQKLFYKDFILQTANFNLLDGLLVSSPMAKIMDELFKNLSDEEILTWAQRVALFTEDVLGSKSLSEAKKKEFGNYLLSAYAQSSGLQKHFIATILIAYRSSFRSIDRATLNNISQSNAIELPDLTIPREQIYKNGKLIVHIVFVDKDAATDAYKGTYKFFSDKGYRPTVIDKNTTVFKKGRVEVALIKADKDASEASKHIGVAGIVESRSHAGSEERFWLPKVSEKQDKFISVVSSCRSVSKVGSINRNYQGGYFIGVKGTAYGAQTDHITGLMIDYLEQGGTTFEGMQEFIQKGARGSSKNYVFTGNRSDKVLREMVEYTQAHKPAKLTTDLSKSLLGESAENNSFVSRVVVPLLELIPSVFAPMTFLNKMHGEQTLEQLASRKKGLAIMLSGMALVFLGSMPLLAVFTTASLGSALAISYGLSVLWNVVVHGVYNARNSQAPLNIDRRKLGKEATTDNEYTQTVAKASHVAIASRIKELSRWHIGYSPEAGVLVIADRLKIHSMLSSKRLSDLTFNDLRPYFELNVFGKTIGDFVRLGLTIIVGTMLWKGLIQPNISRIKGVSRNAVERVLSIEGVKAVSEMWGTLRSSVSPGSKEFIERQRQEREELKKLGIDVTIKYVPANSPAGREELQALRKEGIDPTIKYVPVNSLEGQKALQEYREMGVFGNSNFEGAPGQVTIGNLDILGAPADAVIAAYDQGALNTLNIRTLNNGEVTITAGIVTINGRQIRISINNNQDAPFATVNANNEVGVNINKINNLLRNSNLTPQERLAALERILIHDIAEAYALESGLNAAEAHTAGMMAEAMHPANSQNIRNALSEVLKERDSRQAKQLRDDRGFGGEGSPETILKKVISGEEFQAFIRRAGVNEELASRLLSNFLKDNADNLADDWSIVDLLSLQLKFSDSQKELEGNLTKLNSYISDSVAKYKTVYLGFAGTLKNAKDKAEFNTLFNRWIRFINSIMNELKGMENIELYAPQIFNKLINIMRYISERITDNAKRKQELDALFDEVLIKTKEIKDDVALKNSEGKNAGYISGYFAVNVVKNSLELLYQFLHRTNTDRLAESYEPILDFARDFIARRGQHLFEDASGGSHGLANAIAHSDTPEELKQNIAALNRFLILSETRLKNNIPEYVIYNFMQRLAVMLQDKEGSLFAVYMDAISELIQALDTQDAQALFSRGIWVSLFEVASKLSPEPANLKTTFLELASLLKEMSASGIYLESAEYYLKIFSSSEKNIAGLKEKVAALLSFKNKISGQSSDKDSRTLVSLTLQSVVRHFSNLPARDFSATLDSLSDFVLGILSIGNKRISEVLIENLRYYKGIISSKEKVAVALDIVRAGFIPTEGLVNYAIQKGNTQMAIGEFERIKADIANGGFKLDEIKDVTQRNLYIDVEYSHFINVLLESGFGLNRMDYESYKEFISGVHRPGEVRLDVAGLAEIDYAIHEAKKLLDFIDKLIIQAKAINKEVVIVANMSYGGFVLDIIEEELTRRGIKMIRTKIGSTESHQNPWVFREDLFNDSDLLYITTNRPVMVVIDGTQHLVDREGDGGKRGRYPDAYQGYRNFVLAYNEALAVVSNDREMRYRQAIGKDGGFIASFGESFSNLKNKIIAILKGIKVSRDYYDFKLWNPGGLRSILRENRQPLVEADNFRPEQLRGPAIIFANVVLVDEEIPPALKKAHANSTHEPAHYDDNDIIKEIFLSVTDRGTQFEKKLKPIISKRYPEVMRILNESPSSFEGAPGQVSTGNLDVLGAPADAVINALASGSLVLPISISSSGLLTVTAGIVTINGRQIRISINNNQDAPFATVNANNEVVVNINKINNLLNNSNLTPQEKLAALARILTHDITEAYALQTGLNEAEAHTSAMMAEAMHPANSQNIRNALSEVLKERDSRQAVQLRDGRGYGGEQEVVSMPLADPRIIDPKDISNILVYAPHKKLGEAKLGETVIDTWIFIPALLKKFPNAKIYVMTDYPEIFKSAYFKGKVIPLDVEEGWGKTKFIAEHPVDMVVDLNILSGKFRGITSADCFEGRAPPHLLEIISPASIFKAGTPTFLSDGFHVNYTDRQGRRFSVNRDREILEEIAPGGVVKEKGIWGLTQKICSILGLSPTIEHLKPSGEELSNAVSILKSWYDANNPSVPFDPKKKVFIVNVYAITHPNIIQEDVWIEIIRQLLQLDAYIIFTSGSPSERNDSAERLINKVGDINNRNKVILPKKALYPVINNILGITSWVLTIDTGLSHLSNGVYGIPTSVLTEKEILHWLAPGDNAYPVVVNSLTGSLRSRVLGFDTSDIINSPNFRIIEQEENLEVINNVVNKAREIIQTKEDSTVATAKLAALSTSSRHKLDIQLLSSTKLDYPFVRENIEDYLTKSIKDVGVKLSALPEIVFVDTVDQEQLAYPRFRVKLVKKGNKLFLLIDNSALVFDSEGRPTLTEEARLNILHEIFGHLLIRDAYPEFEINNEKALQIEIDSYIITYTKTLEEVLSRLMGSYFAAKLSGQDVSNPDFRAQAKEVVEQILKESMLEMFRYRDILKDNGKKQEIIELAASRAAKLVENLEFSLKGSAIDSRLKSGLKEGSPPKILAEFMRNTRAQREGWYSWSAEVDDSQIDPFFRKVAELESEDVLVYGGGSDLVQMLLGESKVIIAGNMAEVNVLRAYNEFRDAQRSMGFYDNVDIEPWVSAQGRTRPALKGLSIMTNPESSIDLSDYIGNYEAGRHLVSGHPEINVPLKHTAIIIVPRQGRVRIYFRTKQDYQNYLDRIMTLPDAKKFRDSPASLEQWIKENSPDIIQEVVDYCAVLYTRVKAEKSGWRFDADSLWEIREISKHLSIQQKDEIRRDVLDKKARAFGSEADFVKALDEVLAEFFNETVPTLGGPSSNLVFDQDISPENQARLLGGGWRVLPGGKIEQKTWRDYDTHIGLIDISFKYILNESLINRLVRLAKEKEAKGETLYILDWGAGNLNAAKSLVKALEYEGVKNFRIIAFADMYFPSKEQIPEKIIFVLGLAENLSGHLRDILKGNKIDAIYSYNGIRYLYNDGNDASKGRFINHVKDLRQVLSSDGFVVFNNFFRGGNNPQGYTASLDIIERLKSQFVLVKQENSGMDKEPVILLERQIDLRDKEFPDSGDNSRATVREMLEGGLATAGDNLTQSLPGIGTQVGKTVKIAVPQTYRSDTGRMSGLLKLLGQIKEAMRVSIKDNLGIESPFSDIDLADMVGNAIDAVMERLDQEYDSADEFDQYYFTGKGAVTFRLFRNDTTGEVSFVLSNDGPGIREDIMNGWAKGVFESSKNEANNPEDAPRFFGKRGQGIFKLLNSAKREGYAVRFFTQSVSEQKSGGRIFSQDEKGARKISLGVSRNATGTDLIITLPSSKIGSFLKGSSVKSPGGIDFRALPISTQPMNITAKSMLSQTALLIPNTRLDKEWSQIEAMLNGGIIPSIERIKEYLSLSCESADCQARVEKVLNGIADILRIEEERCSQTELSLRQILILLESDTPASELRLALFKIKVAAGEPQLVR